MHRELLLVRHAEAHCNTTGTIAANTCTGLTTTGTHQVEQLAHRLKAEHAAGHPLAQLYTSPIRVPATPPTPSPPRSAPNR